MMKFFKIYLFMTLMLLAISPLRMSSAPRKSPTTYVKEKVVNLTNYSFSHIADKQAFQKELERQIRMLLK